MIEECEESKFLQCAHKVRSTKTLGMIINHPVLKQQPISFHRLFQGHTHACTHALSLSLSLALSLSHTHTHTHTHTHLVKLQNSSLQGVDSAYSECNNFRLEKSGNCRKYSNWNIKVPDVAQIQQ